MPLLFEPIQLREILLRNRIVVSPMCQYSSDDGFANDWHLVHLGSRAVGGAGLIIVEASSVSPEGRITPSDLGIWKDNHIPFLKRIAEFLQSQGAVPGIQLAHAGRKASRHVPWKGGAPLTPGEGAWQTIAPSAMPFKEGESIPLAMAKEDINKVINEFHTAGERALKAGFKVVEIHAAHGYLINEFLSPLSNVRKDEYGGSFENRIRLLIEITRAVRQSWPEDYPLLVRISSTDWVDGGWSGDDSVKLAGILKNEGVDLIDCSSGGNSSTQKIQAGPLYQVPFAERIRKETGLRTGAVGLITTVHQAEEILANQQADLIIFARQLLRDPYFPLHAAKELGIDIPWPVQYERAKQ
jgi:2,4-dienoyl-CoA reductase-like NADH-dependent reductase (Old Yellow Enzyme family)